MAKRLPLTRAVKSDEELNMLQKSNCIAAIDFGTSSVSLAYTTPLNKGEIQLYKFDGEHYRVPNAILIKISIHSKQCTVMFIGYKAQIAYSKLKKTNQQMDKYIYFERIKMWLKEDKDISHMTTVCSITDNENYKLLEVIAFIINYLKNVLLYQCRGEQYKASDFDWVITVPAIWKARARRMMREAAYLAGLTCDDGGITKFTDTSRGTLPRPLEVNPHKLTLALKSEVAAIYAHKYSSRPPPRYMVVDIGGGTVDITVHDRSNGGILTTLVFRHIIEVSVGDKEYLSFIDSRQPINNIISCVKSALDQLKYKVNTIYLVGEFRGSYHILYLLQEALTEQKGIVFDHMICPQQADLAVTIGAVMWRQAPDIIQSRIADATYGIGVGSIFDSSNFQVFIHKGNKIEKGFYYKISLALLAFQSNTISIYATTENNVEYTVEKEGQPIVHKICQLSFTDVKHAQKEEKFVEISIEFTDNEILVTGKVSPMGEVVRTVCDFLSFHKDIEISEDCKESLLETKYKILYKESEMRKQQIEKSHETLMHRFKMKENSYTQLQRSHTQLQEESTHLEENHTRLQERLEELQSQLELKENELDTIHSQLKAKGDIENWTISHKELNITSHELGRGGWGAIRKGQLKLAKVAVKQIHESIISQYTVEQLNREIATMAQLRHPNLLQFIGAIIDHPSGNPMIITEVMDTSLRKAYEVKELTPDQQPVILSIMRDVAVGLNYLHSLPDPIIHRDVSSANVLLNRMGPGKWQTKISDFGSAKLAKLAETKAPGAMVYTAPECKPLPQSILKVKPSTVKQTPLVDSYSYGILLCETLTCQFPEEDNFQIMLEQVRTSSNNGEILYNLIVSCLQQEPDKRPTTAKIVTILDRHIP